MKLQITLAFFLISAYTMAQNNSTFTGSYPVTRTTEQTDEFFGTKVSDPFRWLEDDRAEDTKDWVKRQNEITEAYMNRIPYRTEIKNRITALWNYEKFSAPFKEGAYTYFYKNNGLQNHAVLYRQQGNATPEIFLDPNGFSKDGTTSLAGMSFSKDGSLAAYQISEGGSDWRKVIVMNTASKTIMPDTLMNIKFSGISWKGNEGFYYSSYDKPLTGSDLSAKTQYHKLFYHKMGTPQSKDVLVFGGEQTPRRYIGGSVTEDQKYLVINARKATYGNELYIMDLSVPKGKIMPLITGYEYETNITESANNKLFFTTNYNASNRKLVYTTFDKLSKENWKDLIPEVKFPLSVSSAGGKFFAQYIKDAVSEVVQYSFAGKKEKTISFPGLGTANGFGGKMTEKDLYYSFTSYVNPPTIYKYNIASGRSDLYKKPNVKFDPTAYESKQFFYTSKDGTKIPLIVTHKKGIALNGTNPTMLYGYGGFNISLTPAFSVSNLVFMEQGGVYAVANLRGGGEYGDTWHNAGTKLKKQNVFDDFTAAAEYLIQQKYTSKEYLAASGGSNGGLLVGAAITQRPELFKVAFPAVGVLDMLRYHKFTSGAGWAYDYGTADDGKEMFDYLYKYSPVHNLKKGTCYPATMVMTGDHDDRVVPAHSFKFAAAIQAAQACNKPVLARIETKAGHGAGKPTAMIIEEQADKWSFLFWNMGVGYKAIVK